MLFQSQKAFGKPAAVIVDEGMWQKGIRGIEARQEIEWTVPIDSLMRTTTARRRHRHALIHRNQLGRGADRQEHNGGVEREHLERR